MPVQQLVCGHHWEEAVGGSLEVQTDEGWGPTGPPGGESMLHLAVL